MTRYRFDHLIQSIGRRVEGDGAGPAGIARRRPHEGPAMRRSVGVCASVLMLIWLPNVVLAVGLDPKGTAPGSPFRAKHPVCGMASGYSPPNFTGAAVQPVNSSPLWTAVYTFAISEGQASLECNPDPWKVQKGTAINIGYGIKVTGRYGHGIAEERVEFGISYWPGDYPPNWNGSWWVTYTWECPKGDPWLSDFPCTLTKTTHHLPPGAKLGTDIGYPAGTQRPSTAKLIPANQKLQFLAQSHPPGILTWPGKSFQMGAPVTIEIKKTPSFANQPVVFEFCPEKGWCPSITKTTTAASLTVPGKEFGQPGTWKVGVRYAIIKGIAPQSEGMFMIVGGQGGGSPGTSAVPVTKFSQTNVLPGPPKLLPPPEDKTRKSASTPEAKRSVTPSVMQARIQPLQLLSAQQQGANQLIVVFQNPDGGAETAGQTVELRLGGQVMGRGRVGELTSGAQERLVLGFNLPPGTRGSVDLEIFVGGKRVGTARVSPIVRRR